MKQPEFFDPKRWQPFTCLDDVAKHALTEIGNMVCMQSIVNEAAIPQIVRDNFDTFNQPLPD